MGREGEIDTPWTSDAMAQVLHTCMTKATTAEGEDIRHSLNWVVSRRGTLRVTSDALECGNWRIAYDDIDEAVLFRTRQAFIPCYVLRVRSHGRIYQFGLNPGSYWKGDLPFPVQRENARLGFSWFSVVVRVFLIGVLLYFVYLRFGR
jgi:hypothetical protein